MFGASVYPELLSRRQWHKLLRQLSELGCTALRAAEACWGINEPSSGRFDFD